MHPTLLNGAKRACPACRRRKIRCSHRITEGQGKPSGFGQRSEVVTNEELDNHSTEGNVTAMERDYDYKSNKSSAAKRVRKGPQTQGSPPSAAGPSSSTPKAAPAQAVIAGIPTTIPRPEDPVDMYDVEEFLSHLEVITGNAKSPRDFEQSEDKLISILGKWNSVYTIEQNPAANVDESRGREVGRNLARLAIVTNREGLLKPLHDYFKKLEVKAEENQRAFTLEDHQEYAEFGHISWVYMQLSQGRFAKYACYGIAETTHAGGVFQRQEEKNRLARLQAEFKSNKVIENKGGMVFGSGGGARGGFEFGDGGSMNSSSLQGDATMGGSKGFSGEQSGSMDFFGMERGAKLGGFNDFIGEQGSGTLAGGSSSFTGQQYGALFGGSTNFTGQQGGGTLASGSTSFTEEQEGVAMGGSTNLTGQQGGGTLASGSTSFVGQSDEGALGGGSGSGTMRRDPFADD